MYWQITFLFGLFWPPLGDVVGPGAVYEHRSGISLTRIRVCLGMLPLRSG
jgi:hypothetical protein